MDINNLKVWLPFDNSPTEDLCGNSWTAYNSADISSANSFNGKALQLSGEYKTNSDLGQYLSLDAGITLGGKDFTIDGWSFMDSSIGSYARLFAIFIEFRTNGNKALRLERSGSGIFLGYDGSSTSTSSNVKGTLFHFAVVYEHSKTLLTFYVNGEKVGTISKEFPETTYTYCYIGRANYKASDTYYYKGTIDEFRVVDGEALWTENFTPPTAADYAALKRQLAGDTDFILDFDTSRKVDTSLKTTVPVSVDFDTSRKVGHFVDLQLDFDTSRIPFDYAVALGNMLRKVFNVVEDEFDTEKKVINSVVFDADTAFKISNFVQLDFDVSGKVIRTVNVNCDTLRKTPHKLISCPAENLVVDPAVDKSKGFQAISISIAEGQLTDQMSFTTVNDIDILQQVIGQIFDYRFSLRVEQISQSGILKTCRCCSDIDELLYTQRAYKLHKETWNDGLYVKNDGKKKATGSYTSFFDAGIYMINQPSANAGAHISQIAAILGKIPVLQFEDFLSSVDIKQEGVTYQDLISEIFGWTSRIPHKMINVFIRDHYLYVIQRGYERNVITFEVSDFGGFANLKIQKSLIRTSYGVTRNSESIERGGKKTSKKGYWELVLGHELNDEDEPSGDDDEGYKEPEDLSQILPSHVQTIENGVTTDIYYKYDDDGNVTQTITDTESSILGQYVANRVIVNNDYAEIDGKKYLSRERTLEYEWSNEDGGWVEVDNKVVIHEYTTVGQQHVSSVSEDGSINGSITTPARHNDKPTPYDKKISAYEPYTVEVDGQTFQSSAYPSYTYQNGKKVEVLGRIWRTEETESDTTVTGTLETVKLYDSSFPVKGTAKLQQITNDIKWLNRKIQETVSFDIYNYPHIFDFNDRIILGNTAYFLQSNFFTQDKDTVNRQSLVLVRWY